MNFILVLSLALTSGAISLIFLFILPLGNRMKAKIAEWVFTFRRTLIIGSFIYSLFFIQNYMNMFHAQERHRQSRKLDNNAFFFEAASMFRSQRDVYLSLLGAISFLGLFVISWQIRAIYIRNEALRMRLDALRSATKAK